MKRTITFANLFLLMLAFVIQIQAQTETKMFRGFLSGKRIVMTLTRDGGKLSGTYFYAKYNTDIKLSGTIDADGKFKLTEYDPKGAKTGEFTGTWKMDENGYGAALEGDWKSPKGGEPLGFIASEQIINFTDGAKLNTKTFAETNKPKRFDLSAEYPELSGADTAIAAKFNALIKSSVMSKLGEFRKPMLAQTAEDLKMLPQGANNYIDISYDVALANNEIISLIFGDGEFTGGAHPNYESFTINYDLKNGSELKLADLFTPNSNYLKVISDYAIADLKKRVGEMSDADWIATGAGAKAENYESWNLTENGLLINFDPYQVAAYAAGPQEVLIPYGKLKNILREDGAINFAK